MDDFQARGAALEYWFHRVGSGDVAFLVDWIVRRRLGQAGVRISLWLRGQGRVVRATSSCRVTGSTVDVAGCTFTPTLSAGAVEDVRWELGCVPGRLRLDPVPWPAKLLHPFDLELVARPRARFTGTVDVGADRFRLVDVTGTLNHYWGRRPPDAWVWVSANLHDDGGDVAVEAALLRTRLWGLRRTGVAGGYLLVDGRGSTSRILAPAFGRVTGRGNVASLEIHARTVGRHARLTGHARRADYNDLGEGIRQTLIGDITLNGWGTCSGSAVLELRGNILTTRK